MLSASVTVEQELVSSIGKGILVFAAMAPGDTEKDAESLANKVLRLKLWDDENGGRVITRSAPPPPHTQVEWHSASDQSCYILQWKKNVQDINGEVLCVSQFTLLASTKKGNKPDFHGALGGDEAKRLYQCFYEKVQEGYGFDKVKNGVFQAMMEVALVNDGPVCLLAKLPSLLPGARDTFSIHQKGEIAQLRRLSADSLPVVQVTLELTAGSQQKSDKPPSTPNKITK